MAGDDDAIATNQHRVGPAESIDRLDDLVSLLLEMRQAVPVKSKTRICAPGGST
jgi:hypothetical protein